MGRLATAHARIGNKVQLVGDDLFVTNVERLSRGIKDDAGNAILIKVNQIGTLTETLDAVEMAHKAGMRCVIRTARAKRKTRRSPTSPSRGAGQIETGSLAAQRPGGQVQPVDGDRRRFGRVNRPLSGEECLRRLVEGLGATGP